MTTGRRRGLHHIAAWLFELPPGVSWQVVLLYLRPVIVFGVVLAALYAVLTATRVIPEKDRWQAAEVFLGFGGVGGLLLAVAGLINALERPVPSLRLEAKRLPDNVMELVLRNIGPGTADRVHVWVSDKWVKSETPPSVSGLGLALSEDWVQVTSSDWERDGSVGWKRHVEARIVDDGPLPGYGSALHVGSFPYLGLFSASARATNAREVPWPVPASVEGSE